MSKLKDIERDFDKNLWRRVSNRLLHLVARFLPGSTGLRPFLHRLRGVKIHGTIFIGDEVYLENEYPECVEIHDGVLIGLRSTIIAHARGPGKIVIEKKAVIAAGCLIVCVHGQTLTIGEGAVISAGSTVSNSIPPYTLCGGPRIKAVGRVTVPFGLDVTYDEFRRGLQPLRTANKNAVKGS
jgi:carbonic anhydrase/acetyltransferase-like protein (isoleucine patch superfamily)